MYTLTFVIVIFYIYQFGLFFYSALKVHFSCAFKRLHQSKKKKASCIIKEHNLKRSYGTLPLLLYTFEVKRTGCYVEPGVYKSLT